MKYNTFLNESIQDIGILKAVFMGGVPGGGKSYVLKKLTNAKIEPRIVNTDIWTEFLKVGGDNQIWMDNADKTKHLTKAQLTHYINSMLPLWVDGTSNKASSLFTREGALKSVGYDTAMVWVTTTLETAQRRAKEREKAIGRHVDPKFIEELWSKANKMKDYYKSHFDVFLEVHNDDGDLNDKVVLDGFRKMTSFYTSPIRNPIGIELKEKMIKNGWKYLNDTDMYDIGDLNKVVSNWYKH
jgi:hypothetical protein